MERLTEEHNGKAAIPLRSVVLGLDLPKWYVVSESPLEKFLLGEAADRLAAYESTGLEPERIQEFMTKWIKVVELAGFMKQEGIEHLRDLVKAEKEGRLLVMPCKTGETVHRHRYRSGCADNLYETCSVFAYDAGACYRCYKEKLVPSIEATCFEVSMLEEIGKTVFLTRKEAEAALAADKSVGHTGGGK